MRIVVASLACLLAMSGASAQTSATYTYDALGRLTKVAPNSGNAVCYGYDLADNRSTVTAGGTCGSAGGAGNEAPTAVDDYIMQMIVGPTYTGPVGFVLANDTDPNLPGDTLTIIGTTGVAGKNAAGTRITVSGRPPGTYYFTYTIKDSGNLQSTANVELILCLSPCEF